jgi:hypothetical protein
MIEMIEMIEINDQNGNRNGRRAIEIDRNGTPDMTASHVVLASHENLYWNRTLVLSLAMIRTA